MNKNLITVITPNYNGEKFLEESIKSVINQSIKNLSIFFLMASLQIIQLIY